MSAPRLTVRIKLQQDHGFSRPLFHKPKKRRWPWVVVLMVAVAGGALYLNPSLVPPRQLSAPQVADSVSPGNEPASTTVVVQAIPMPTPSTAPSTTTAPTVELTEPAAADPAVVVEPGVATTVELAVTAAPTESTGTERTVAPEPAAEESQPEADSEAQPLTSNEQPPAPAAAEVVVAESSIQAAADAASADGGRSDRVVDGSKVSRALLAREVASREPISAIDVAQPLTLSEPTPLFYFTELRDMSGSHLSHRWYHNGAMVKERDINVGAIRWRTWSRHVLDGLSGGDWRVELVTADGQVLAHTDWQVNGATP